MITFGSDCEFVLVQHGKIKSAVPVLKGTREKRERVSPGHEFFHDNVLAEVAIAPGKTREEVVGNFKSALQTLSLMVRPCLLTLYASADYPSRELNTPDALEAGCTEETDAYAHKTLPSQENAIKTGGFRTAGGHIHLGGKGVLQDSIRIPLIVYMMDVFVGLPSLFLDNNILSKERRTLYGKAGSYREKPYGLEYRVLSPFWLRSPDTVRLFYNLSLFAVNFVESGKVSRFWSIDEEKLMAGKIQQAYHCSGYDKNAVIKAINEYDMKTAETFLFLLDQYLPSELMESFHKEREANHDFYESWELFS